MAGDRSWRLRVSTISRKISNPLETQNSLDEIGNSFDQEAAAVLIARLSVDNNFKGADSKESLKKIDKTLIHLMSKFAKYTKDNPNTFKLTSKFNYFPQFMFYLRRSSFIQSFNESPDESTYYKFLLLGESVQNCTVMIQPLLFEYTAENPSPTPVFLDLNSLKNNCVLLLDTFFHVVVWHGIDVMKWREEGYQDQEGYENIKQMLDEVMPIAYIMEGKTDDEYRAEQEMLRDIQVDVPNMDKLHGKYFEIMSSRTKVDKSIARVFDAAEGNYMDVPYETMKDLVLSRSKMNKTLGKLHQMIRRIKPNFKEPDVVVNTIPPDEYESLLKEYIEVGAKQYDKLFAEYMTPEDVEEVNAAFKSLDEKLATSVPAQTEGVARMESMEAQYKAFIESVCAEFGCTDAIRPLQEGFAALCEAV